MRLPNLGRMVRRFPQKPGEPADLKDVMKTDIHPIYRNSTISCACGASYDTRSTRGSYAVDICSACHPFFTGKSRILDKEGRVEKFKARYGSKKK